MVETLKLKEENRIKKVIKIAETRMAVERERERERERVSLYSTWNSFTRLYIVYCHLKNKKEKLNSNKNKGRTMPNRKIGIVLPFRAF